MRDGAMVRKDRVRIGQDAKGSPGDAPFPRAACARNTESTCGTRRTADRSWHGSIVGVQDWPARQCQRRPARAAWSGPMPVPTRHPETEPKRPAVRRTAASMPIASRAWRTAISAVDHPSPCGSPAAMLPRSDLDRADPVLVGGVAVVWSPAAARVGVVFPTAAPVERVVDTTDRI